jgi:GNAT superfamily N-acetyltransferase
MIGCVPHLSPAHWDDPVVQDLATAQQEEMRARYDGDIEPGVKPSAADIAVVLVARDDDGTPLGCGALRPLEPGAAELKRMYVVPAARGRGVSRLLLSGLEAEAAARGWTTLRLETGTRQPEAVGLYSSAGYRPVPAFGHYVGDDTGDSLYFAREITSA